MPDVELSSQLADWVVVESNKSTDGVFFNVESYKGKIVPFDQLFEETYTYFAEHLKVPTIRKAYWNGERWRHPDGTPYNVMFDQGIASAPRKDIRKRYEAEKEGWKNAGVRAATLEPFLIVSLPGTVYRNQYGAKNMTYYADPLGREGDEVVYEVLSIPCDEKTGDVHAEAVFELVGEVIERDPDLLVSIPFIATGAINALDIMAEGLGYQNYALLEKVARKSLESADDPKSWTRRTEMVTYFSQSLYDIQSNVFMSDSKKMIAQRVVSEAMRYFFAMETGSSYVGKDFSEIENKIASYILDGITKHSITQGTRNLTVVSEQERLNLWEIREREVGRMLALTNNKKALDSYRVIACNTTKETGGSNIWNESKLDPLAPISTKDLFGKEITPESQDGANKELSDGETACYPCPLCGGEVKRIGDELVCQKKPDQHHIKYQSQTD